jgi:ectoine hydroxylase-related dioxygenase (phytanoyl-CoA dioxygenase family)
MKKTAAHRQTGYLSAPGLDNPDVLPIPRFTSDINQAKADLSEYGMCLLTDVLDSSEVKLLRDKLSHQARAEQDLGDLAPPGAMGDKQIVSNMVNKGSEFLQLVGRTETDELAGYMMGKDFLLSSLTGHLFNRPTTEPQVLHRDQGQVPATVDFPAACNLFWLLDDFSPERGSTFVVPGSHRWRPEYLIRPPSRDQAVQIEAPAGSIFAWDGRLWHGTGISRTGHPRRTIALYFCLPWMRQQENWGVTCLQGTLDEADPKIKARLGLRTYGTLGMMSGTKTPDEIVSLGNSNVSIPEYIIGEDAELFPMSRVGRRSSDT